MLRGRRDAGGGIDTGAYQWISRIFAKNKSALFLSIYLLAGCTSPYSGFEKEIPTAGFAQDHRVCQVDADAAADRYDQQAERYENANDDQMVGAFIGSAIAERHAKKARYQACMKSKGYQEQGS